MAKKVAAALAVPEAPVARFVGDNVVMKPLGSVKPNSWNPNGFTPFMLESLKQGLLSDGWLKSQALLIWGKDEKGKTQNLIIDGEHRWQVAPEVGFKEAPMVFLNGITEAQAKALTIKIDAKRGAFNPTDLGALLRELESSLGLVNAPVELGIPQDDYMAFLAMPAIEIGAPGEHEPAIGAPPGEVASGMDTHVKMVQLYFSKELYEEFQALLKECAPVFKTENASDTTMEALRRARSTQKSRR